MPRKPNEKLPTDPAELAGTTQAKVSEYLAGKVDVRTETAHRMMRALGLEVKKRRGG